MADAFDQFQTLLREFISPAVIDLELEDDDPAWNMMGTFEPDTVGGKRAYSTSSSDFPSGYEARFEIKVQSGGRVAGGTFGGSTTVMMGKDSHLAMGQAADDLFLDPTKTPSAAHIEIRMILKKILGSVVVNQTQLEAQRITRPIDELVGDHIEDSVRRLRGYLLNGFYGDGTASLAQVNASSPTDPVETAGGTSITIDGGTWGRFMMGDVIVFGSHAEPRVQRAGNINGHLRVVAIDSNARNIKLQSMPNEGTIDISDNDHLMLADTYDFSQTTHAAASRVTEGVESLLIETGTFPGSTSPTFTSGLDVTHHTALQSFVTDNSSAMKDPTMETLTLLLDKILDSGVAPPTAFIGERSLWTLHAQLERENNALVTVPMAAQFVAAGGVAGPVLSHMEHRFQKFSSVRIRPNSIVGLNPSTWRRFMPMGDRTINWVAENGPLAGLGSLFLPV